MNCRHFILPLFLSASLLHAQQPLRDAAPPDSSQILQALRMIRDQQLKQKKAQREKALRDVQAAGASPSVAAASWEDAVRQVQFEGMPKEGAAFREWREGQGDALSAKECQTALQLYFRWLALTLHRANGATIRELLPNVVQYTKDLQADQLAIEDLEERMKREEEAAQDGKRGAREKRQEDQSTKRMHDDILLQPLQGSPPVKALGIDEFLDAEAWEMNPGNLDGIFQSIILPELRALNDARVLEYWDMKIKREGEKAQKTKRAFDLDKFNNERRPQLLWNKAHEYANLGLRNRAVTETFMVLKTYPTHPNASNWIADIELLLSPEPAPSAPAPGATPAPGTAPATGGAASP
jgi:hypothetical protein